MKVPKCNRCEGTLHPEENHACPGYRPKYPVLPSTQEALDEQKAMREYTRDDNDDDQYDRTSPGEMPRNPDEEDRASSLKA